MGALIRTSGTKLIAAHLNEEFSAYIGFYRHPPHAALFNSGSKTYKSLYDIIYNRITDNVAGFKRHARRSDFKCLLPNISPQDPQQPGFAHSNLEKRWLWFLNPASRAKNPQYTLTKQNDKVIAGNIHKALTPDRGGRFTYGYITFDAVESLLPQDVIVTQAYDEDDTLYMQIVLMTPNAIPAAGLSHSLPRLDRSLSKRTK